MPIIGTSPDAIDLAEDRDRFRQVLDKLGLRQPENGIARSLKEALEVAGRIGYPLVVRPSYVLGGRAMQVVSDLAGLERYVTTAVQVNPEHPILLDRFVDGAVELDVDCVSDGRSAVIGGVMEHVEEAGIHSGDSACSLPPWSVPESIIEEVERQTKLMARELRVVGLMNVQFAVRFGSDRGDEIYVLEVNPRASRTIPFVSKAIGRPLARIGARVMAGRSLEEVGFTRSIRPDHISVKECVLPFGKFGGVDVLLGPEMKSTGEVMGIGPDFATAFLKSQRACSFELPLAGAVLLSVDDPDKAGFVGVARRLVDLGFTVLATSGTWQYLVDRDVRATRINKEQEGGDHVVTAIEAGRVQVVMCTTRKPGGSSRALGLRRAALRRGVPYYTTLVGARAATRAIERLASGPVPVRALQDYHPAPRGE